MRHPKPFPARHGRLASSEVARTVPLAAGRGVSRRGLVRPFHRRGRYSTALVIALGTASMFLGPASNALAACAPAAGAGTPPAGTTVTCAGTTLNQNSPNGYGDGSQTEITVNVQQAASVTGRIPEFCLAPMIP